MKEVAAHPTKCLLPEIVILGERVVEYDQPRTVRLQVLLEGYPNSYDHTERRLAPYELGNESQLALRIGYLLKDAPRRTGQYLATLQRAESQKRLTGKPSPLQEYEPG